MSANRIQAGEISLEQLIALNDELAALARAGLPLERGLMGAGEDLPGRLGAIARRLAARMELGSSLAEAMQAEGPRLPGTYRAVVEAGLRSGRLAEALEGLAGFARQYVELRRGVGLALIYPALVLMLAYGLFLAFVLELMPRLRGAFTAIGVPMSRPVLAIESLGDSAMLWGPILPTLVLGAFLAWLASGRASAFEPGKVGRGLRWVPWMGAILDGAVSAQFADWLALLIEHGVPWGEAVTLAADATGDRTLAVAAREIAGATARGESVASSVRKAGGFPPLLAWLLSTGRDQGTCAPALRHAAGTYRRRALRKAALLRTTLPSLLLVGIGASATLLYMLTLFVPWTNLLNSIARMR